MEIMMVSWRLKACVPLLTAEEQPRGPLLLDKEELCCKRRQTDLHSRALLGKLIISKPWMCSGEGELQNHGGEVLGNAGAMILGRKR